MQNPVISLKVFGIILATLFVAVIVSSPISARAADLSSSSSGYTYTPSSSSGYTYTPSSSSGSTYTSSSNSGYTYTPSSSSGYTYTPSSSSGYTYTPSTNYGYTYTPSSSSGYTYTPGTNYGYTYTPGSSSGYTYTPHTTSYGGCTSNCGGGGCTSNCGGTVTPNPTCTISVNKHSINKGEAVTVTWNSSNATYGNISNLGTNVPPSGSYTLYPQSNTTFTGTFFGNGKQVTCVTNVVVTEPAPDPTCNLYATPSAITSGQSVSISWNSTNASGATISNVGNNLSPNGSYVVYPSQTTTYTGTFYSNTGKQVTCSTTVTVSVQQCPSGYSGSYPNCVPPVYNAPSCSITINN
ncbi:MAG: hypothetical protein V4436_03030, partial [Patescibacteria group bacterium]